MIKVISVFSIFSLVIGFYSAAHSQTNNGSILFYGQDYLYRWSQGNQFEFTPTGQEDLKTWTDLMTVWVYPQATDGNGLAEVANTVLGNYQSVPSEVLRTNSLPATADKPTEHFVAVVLGDANLLEFVAARFVLINGQGLGIIYSHRIYGEGVGDTMSEWLGQNGALIEEAVMGLEASQVVTAVENPQ